MPHFMVSCNYSTESKNAMIANPVDRTKAASAAVEALGGKLHSAFLTFGETDIIVIYEAPDAIASAATWLGSQPATRHSHGMTSTRTR